MMRAVILAGALALATPAWAGNDDHIEAVTTVCREAARNLDTCIMERVPEAQAIVVAARTIEACKTIAAEYPQLVVANEQCAESRAYIKQRWGY